MISPFAMAADVDGPSLSAFVSDEYLSTAAADDTIAHPVIGFTIEAEYTAGDIIDLTFSGDALEADTLPTSVIVACNLDTNQPGVTLGLLSQTAGEATYRVTELDGTCLDGVGTTIGITFDVCTGAAPCLFNARAVDAANGVTLGFSAQTGTGFPLDTGGGANRTEDVFVTGSQFAAEFTGFNGIIDVEQDRELFTDGCCDFGEYDLTTDAVPDAAEAGVYLADFVDQDVSLAGNFSFLFDTDPDTEGLQPDPDVVNWFNCGELTYTATAISAVECGAGFGQIFINVLQNTDSEGGLAVLEATTFATTHTINFIGIGEGEGSIVVGPAGLGQWTLNGFQAKVAYMPFQTGITQVIYLANRGVQTGEITIDWIGEDGSSGSFSIGDLPAGSTRAIGPAINAGLPADKQERGRLALVITANVPACDAQLNAQYNVGGDRAFSVASSNCPVDANFVGFD
jgi:hypothetical protein